MDPRLTQNHPGAVSPEALIAEARKLLGDRKAGKPAVPYRHQGRSLRGLDCIGLIIYVCERMGVLPQEFERNDYGRLATQELVDKTAVYCRAVDEPGPGVLVLIKWPGERRAGHAALCTGENLIHCDRTHGRVVEHGYRGHWVKQTASLWHLPGVNYAQE